MNDRVVHPALSRPLRKRMSVMDPLGNVGTVVGFHSTRSWGFRRPVRDAWVIVEFKPQRRSYMAAADLRVVERKVA